MTYPQVIDEKIFSENDKRFLDLEILTEPGTTNKVVKKLNRGKVSVKGFRRGKVPKEVLERVVGKEAIYVEKMTEQYNAVCKSKDYGTVTDPNLLEWKEEKDGSLRFKVKVEVMEEFDISEKDYLGIEVERDTIDEKKLVEAYENYLKSLERQFGSYRPVDRPCQRSDFILVSLELYIEGKLRREFSAEKEFIQLEDKTLGKEITEAIVGSSAGDNKTVDFAFAEDHTNSDFKGKQAQIRFDLESVKEHILHPRNDDIAKQTNLQVSTLDELRIKFEEEYNSSQEQMIDRIFELSCMEQALKNIRFTVPTTMIANEVKSLMQYRYQMFDQMGYPKENAFKNLDFTLINKQAENRIAAALMFNKLFKKGVYKIESVTEEEVDTSIKGKAEADSKTYEEIKKQYQDDMSIRNLKKEILYDRFVKDVVTNAKAIAKKEHIEATPVAAPVIEETPLEVPILKETPLLELNSIGLEQ